MTTIHEIQQVIIVNTCFGLAHALFILDYGPHLNTIWICASNDDGQIRHFDSSQISITTNHTLTFNLKKND